jgi:hypothetical protein
VGVHSFFSQFRNDLIIVDYEWNIFVGVFVLCVLVFFPQWCPNMGSKHTRVAAWKKRDVGAFFRISGIVERFDRISHKISWGMFIFIGLDRAVAQLRSGPESDNRRRRIRGGTHLLYVGFNFHSPPISFSKYLARCSFPCICLKYFRWRFSRAVLIFVASSNFPAFIS